MDDKPTRSLVSEPVSFDQLVDLFRSLTGHDPTLEELEESRQLFETQGTDSPPAGAAENG
jgi:hypothetical protein